MREVIGGIVTGLAFLIPVITLDFPQKQPPPAIIAPKLPGVDRTNPPIKEGYYKAVGQGPEAPYRCLVSIRKVRSVHLVKWYTEDGTVIGVGQRITGNILSVGWSTKGMVGVSTFMISEGKLEGTYLTIPTTDGLPKTETLKFFVEFDE